MLTEQELTRDHWWWRPRWRMGRSFYTWHVTFAPGSPAWCLVDAFAPLLAELPTMAPVDADGLHITIQGIGFADEVSDSDLRRIADAAARRLARRHPISLRIGPAIVDQETIQLPISNPAELGHIRDELQSAIAEVWGQDHVPEAAIAFRPHLTVAYSTGVAPIAELRARLAQSGLDGLVVEESVAAVSLIELNRDYGRYEWADLEAAPLAPN